MFAKPVTVYGPIGIAGLNPAVFRGLPPKIKLRETVRKIMMRLLIHCDICRFLTPFAADRIIECGADENKSSFPRCLQKKIIRHPQTGISLDDPEYRTERKREDDGKIRLLICSEFLHWKGVTFACEVFCRTAKLRNNVELVICGSGSEEKNMRRILEKGGVLDRAVFKGFVSKQEMFQELCDADILLYPSYHHGLATLILQAMYARLPIVCIKGDPVALAVSEGAGLAAEGNSLAAILDDLTAKTLQLVDSDELRNSFGHKAHQLVLDNYDWQKMCAVLAGHLEKFAEEKR
jgi:glycosyltransferase involved in cell wall biosynthesis